MDSKPFYLSKGVIGGVFVCLGAVGLVIARGTVDVEAVTLFGTGLGLIGIRTKLN